MSAPTEPFSKRLQIKVCKLFYLEGFNKTEIEKKLHISRFKVARILQRAQKEGLVRIELVEPEPDLSDFESRLEKELGLKSVVLVSDDGESGHSLKQKVGKIAAEYLLSILDKGNVLGVGWGTTTFQLVEGLPENIGKKVSVVQVSGGNTKLDIGIDSQALTMSLARKFGVSPHLLHAPAIVDRFETKKALIQESSLAECFHLHGKMDVLVAGIGAFVNGGFLGTRQISKEEMETLRRQKAAGEILYYCFDINGRLCPTDTLERLIAMPLKDIKRVACSIGIAVGHEKADAVLGAARSGLINTLITDTATAQDVWNNICSHQKKERTHE